MLMKNLRIISLLISIFASHSAMGMQRNRLGNCRGQITSGLNVLFIVVRSFYSNIFNLLENENPFFYNNSSIDVVETAIVNDTNTDNSNIIVSNANIEFGSNHLTLQAEHLAFIFWQIGPLGRSNMRLISRGFRTFIDYMRRPRLEGGMGITDFLPIVHILNVGGRPRHVLVIDQNLYVINNAFPILSIFNAATHATRAFSPLVVTQSERAIRVGSLLLVFSLQNQVYVIDTEQGHQTSLIPTHIGSGYTRVPIVIGSMVYVLTNEGVYVIDTATRLVTQTDVNYEDIDNAPFMRMPPFNRMSLSDYNLAEIFFAEMLYKAMLEQGITPNGEFSQHSIAVGSTLYLSIDHSVMVIDLSTRERLAWVSLGIRWETNMCARQPLAVGSYLYVSNTYHNSVSVIDMTTNTLVCVIPVGKGPWQPVEVGSFLFVVNYGGTVSVINTNTHKVIATISVGKGAQKAYVNGHYLYVPSMDEAKVYVIDLRSYLPPDDQIPL